MDYAEFDKILKLLPLPAILTDSKADHIIAVNELASQSGFCSDESLVGMMENRSVESWLRGSNAPGVFQTQILLHDNAYSARAALRRVNIAEKEGLIIVFTSIKEVSIHDENATVAGLCDIYASGQKNALVAFLQASAMNMGAFCAVVYEKRKERYTIREEWRNRRTVCVSMLGADFENQPENKMERIVNLKRAVGFGYARYTKTYGTRGVLIYFFDTPTNQTIQPRIEKFARLLRVLSPDIPRHGSSAVVRQGLDTLQQGIAIWDKSTKRLLYENRAYHALFGGKVPYTEGRNGVEPITHSDAAGRHYSLTHSAGRMGMHRFITTFVADVTRYKLAEQKLAMTAKTDSLTGLYNRRAGLDILQEVYTQSRKTNKLLTVGFADIDGLKQINDTYGHGTGDAMIRSVAEVLKKSVGKVGTVCRLGGDEFVMVLPEINKVQALLMAEQIKKAVSRCFVGGSRGITISFGFKQAEYTQSETAASLVSVADSDMYRDKRDKSAE